MIFARNQESSKYLELGLVEDAMHDRTVEEEEWKTCVFRDTGDNDSL